MAVKTKGKAKGAAKAAPIGVIAKAMSFDNVPDAGFEPLPADEYELILEKAYTRKSKNKGTPEVALEWSVVDGQFKGRRVFDDLYWTEGSRFRVINLCKALGLELEGMQTPESVAEMLEPGSSVLATLSVDMEYGTNKVRKYKPVA